MESLARLQASDAVLEKSTLQLNLKDADRTAKSFQQDKETVIGVSQGLMALNFTVALVCGLKQLCAGGVSVTGAINLPRLGSLRYQPKQTSQLKTQK